MRPHQILSTFRLAKILFLSDLKSKYRESYLGYAWTLAPAVILTFSFYLAVDSNVIQTNDLPLPYPVFAYSGIILWQLFTELILSFSQGLTKSKTLLVKMKVDTNAIIVSKIFESLFDFMIKLIFLFVLLILYKIPVTKFFILLPFFIFFITLGGIIAGLIISPFVMLVQDLNRILPTVLSFGMFLTPIFYHTATGGIALLNAFNPIGQLIVSTRALFYGEIVLSNFVLMTILTLIVLLPLTYRFYKISIPVIVEKIGN